MADYRFYLDRVLTKKKQSIHPDAQDWYNRAVSAGGTISQDTLANVSTFCKQITDNSLRSKFVRFNPFLGDNLAAALTPLYRNINNVGYVGNEFDTSNFIASDYNEQSGLQGNGSKFINTGVNPFLTDIITLNNIGYVVYPRSGVNNGNSLIGCNDDNFNYIQRLDPNIRTLITTSGNVVFANANWASLINAQRIGDNIVLRINQILNIIGPVAGAAVKPNFPISVFGRNSSGSTIQIPPALYNCYAINVNIENQGQMEIISNALYSLYANYSRNTY